MKDEGGRVKAPLSAFTSSFIFSEAGGDKPCPYRIQAD